MTVRELLTGNSAENCSIKCEQITATVQAGVYQSDGMKIEMGAVTNTTDIQIANVTDSVDILSTKLTIDSAETGSDTAATAAVIDTSKDDLATNDLLRIDVDAVSTTPAKGLIVTIECRLP